ncbi:MAG: hypothetical protein IVW54_06735 [Candidatus Binataceae bacterium]|nr:hypothetical protein [Candidatus Binataceae bacterium]
MTPYEMDDPRRRLIWVVPLAVILWAAVLLSFSRLLERTTPLAPELIPVEARIVEIAPSAGLQGGFAAPAKAQARAEPIRRPVPIVHPRAIHHAAVHHRKIAKPIAPSMPPAPTGIAKTIPPATATASRELPSGKAGTSAPAGIGAAGATGSGAGLGSDSTGARAVYAPTPEIPDELRENAFNAVAVAHFKVAPDGTVEVALIKPTSNPRINAILIDTLRQWRFFPAMKGSAAISSEFDVRIPITIQ